MTWSPRTVIGDCLHCGGSPEPKFKPWSISLVRMECKCGVAGAWQRYDGGDLWHSAVRGWHGREIELRDPPKRR